MRGHTKTVEEGFDYGAVLPWVPLAGAVLLMVWVARVGTYDHPVTKLVEVAGITVVMSAVLSLLDADRSARLAKGHQTLSAPTWFLFQLLAWPVAYPAYLHASQKDEHPGRVAIGWIAALCFVVAAIYTWHHTGTAPGAQPVAGYSARFTPAPFQDGITPRSGTVGTSGEAVAASDTTNAPAVAPRPQPSTKLAGRHPAPDTSGRASSPNHSNITVQRLQPKGNSR